MIVQVVVCILLVARASLALAESQGVLSLESVLTSADRSFPLVIAAVADQEAAAAEARVARGAFDPVVRAQMLVMPFGYYEQQRLDTWLEVPTALYGTTFYGGYRLGLGNIADYDGKAATNSGGELRAGVRVPLLRDGWIDRRRVGRFRAALGVDIASLTTQQQRLEVRRMASLRYWDWVAAGQRLRLARGLLELAVERDAAIGARVLHGDLPTIERIDNARAIAQREAQVAVAVRQLQQAAIELSLFWRDEQTRPIVAAEDSLPRLPPAEERILQPDESGALQRRPEPQRLLLQRRQGELELRLARNQLLPTLDATFFVSQDLGAGSSTRGPLAGELGLLFDLPVFLRSSIGRLDAARAALRKVTVQLGLAEDRIVAEVRDATSAVEAAATRYATTTRELELARELERLERAKFELGDSHIFFVNQREQATVEAGLRQVDASADYWKSRAIYQTAVAAPPSS